jgi:transforming growth factor-beta-induced protein
MQLSTTLFAALLGAALVPSAVAGDTCSTGSSAKSWSVADKDIVSTAVEAGSFKTLAAALKAADLVGALQGEGPFTVFAPTDEAFAKLPKGTLESLLEPENKALLANVLTYHVVPGKVTADKVVGLRSADALNGQRLPIHVEDGTVVVAGAQVVKTDVMASNGVIHVIDTVMMPATANLVATAAEAGTFRTLLAAAEAAGLAETLAEGGPFTVLAPNDAAFAKLPAGTVESLLKPENKDRLVAILKLHVIPGRAFAAQVAGLKELTPLAGGPLAVRVQDGQVSIGAARVLATDVQASNGVIHVLDSVLLPAGGR